MTLQAAADELYGLPPEQFTAARDDFAARLRKAGERELAVAVRELRRPSVPAWLVNLLVRHRAAGLDRLLETGDQLRSAMASGAGDDVRRLSNDRRSAVGALVTGIEELADRPVTPAVLDDVVATLEAATADHTAATAVRSGRLVRALHYAGFGELPDLSGAVGLAPAAPSKPRRATPSPAATKASAAERRSAERAAQEAAGAADDAQRAYELRAAQQAQARAGVESAEGAVSEAAARLENAQAELATARHREKAAESEAAAAHRSARAAHAAAEVARRHLADVRSGQ